ncbi:MAG: hypothetical protein SOI56_07895 [Eubacteriales bacterium]|jgi:hypothetical protein
MSRRKYSFLKNDDSRNSKRSIALSAVSAIIFIILILVSIMAGVSGPASGAFGLMALIFSVIAFALGVKALTNHEGKQNLAVIGTMMSGVVMILWGGIFILGIHS